MRVLNPHQNAGQDGILERLFEVELEILELFADEPHSEDGDFSDSQVFSGDVLGDFFNDAWPLFSGHLDAADGCDYLNGLVLTLAAALRIIFYRSIMMLRTASLKVALAGVLNRSHR